MAYYRTPRTRQEMALSIDPEHADYVRSKRYFRNLPDAWDDKPHARRGRPDKHKNHRRK